MMVNGISKCDVKVNFSMDVNLITCHSLEDNTGEFTSKFVSQIWSYNGYIGSSTDDYTAWNLIDMPYNEKFVVVTT